MKVIKEGGALVKMWTDGVHVDSNAMDQVKRIASMPFIEKHVAVMPDVHLGMGATIGSVIPTKGAIIPAAVGVDIGCGMIAARLSLTASDLPDNLAPIRSAIESAVPHGRTDNGGPNDRGAWKDVPKPVQQKMGDLMVEYAGLTSKHQKVQHRYPMEHCGTLGTGNHFIEICLDEKNSIWVMLHSGSRGPGNRIGTYFIRKAKEDMRRWFINLPDVDLAYIPDGSPLFQDYWRALSWAQKYALTNRELMMTAILKAMEKHLPPFVTSGEAVNCHHNYVEPLKHGVYLTRKGAVSARRGQLGIIPGSMGAKSFIVSGKGNPESWFSCSHGAGRRMSRREAKRRFTVEDHERATSGVECRKDAEVLDETPAAYKDIDSVMAAQADLVEIVHTLRQVVCVKG